MKNIYKSIGVLALSGMLFTSCSEDDHTGLSALNYTPPAVTLTSSENNVTINENAIVEDGYSITVTATIGYVVPVNIIVPLVQTGGSANGDDFSAGSITISAGNLSGSTTVDVYATGDVEGNETLTIGAGDLVANASVNSFSLNININDDYINDVFSVELDWSGTYTFPVDAGDLTIDSCDMDIDILVYDAAFADTGIYDGATSACPEHVDFSGLADGTYYLVANVYDNPFADSGADEAIPMTINYSQEFFQDGSFSFAGLSVNTPAGTDLLFATLEVSNGYGYVITPQ